MTDKQAAIEAITTEKSRLYDFANNPNLTQFELKHEVIKYCAGLTGYISQLRAALQSKTVDVEALEYNTLQQFVEHFSRLQMIADYALEFDEAHIAFVSEEKNKETEESLELLKAIRDARYTNGERDTRQRPLNTPEDTE